MSNASATDLDPLNFSLWLNSDRMEGGDSNVASYIYRPPCPINVPSNADWRVALLSISVPRRVINLHGFRGYAKDPNVSRGRWRGFLLDTCHCSNPMNMIAIFNRALHDKMGQLAYLQYNPVQNRFSFNFTQPETFIQLQYQLANLVGFQFDREYGISEEEWTTTRTTAESRIITAEMPPDLMRGSHYVFVETNDLIIPTFQDFTLETFSIPESSTTIISNEAVSGGSRDSEIYTFRPIKPIYFAVKPACISEIKMVLRNERGDVIHFELPFSPVIVQLQFRRKGYFV